MKEKVRKSSASDVRSSHYADILIVNQLKQMMRLRHVDLYDLSNLSGVRLSFLVKVFSCKVSLSLKTFVRLSDCLDCFVGVFPRSEYTIISYLYDDYRNLVHKYNVLLGETGTSVRYELFPFERIDFSLDDE